VSSGQIMRIAVLGPSLFGLRERYCGLFSHTATLARGLHELGHHVVVFAGPRHAVHQLPIEVVPIIDRPLPAITTARLDTSTPAWFARHETHGYPPFKALELAHQRLRQRRTRRCVVAVTNNLASVWGKVPTHTVHNGVDVDAANSLGWQLVLTGPVQDQDYFDTEIAPRLTADITWLGPLDAQQLRELYANSNVGVPTATWDEPLGLVAAEMLSCGLPLAALDRGAIGESTDPSVAVLTPGDSGQLAGAIRAAARLDRDDCRRARSHVS